MGGGGGMRYFLRIISRRNVCSVLHRNPEEKECLVVFDVTACSQNRDLRVRRPEAFYRVASRRQQTRSPPIFRRPSVQRYTYTVGACTDDFPFFLLLSNTFVRRQCVIFFPSIRFSCYSRRACRTKNRQVTDSWPGTGP